MMASTLSTSLFHQAAGDLDEVKIVSGFVGRGLKFNWEIQNFDQIQRSGQELIDAQGIDITVPAGEEGHLKTNWRVYLNVVKIERKSWIGLFHKLKKDDSNEALPATTMVSSKIAIPWNSSGAGGYWFQRKALLSLKKIQSADATAFGFQKVIDMGLPIKSLPLKHGSLIIEGDLQIFTERQTEASCNVQEAERRAMKELAQDLNFFWKSPDSNGSVKVVSLDGVEFVSNKFILSARSPVFAAMFNSSMMETETGVLKISDASGEGLSAMLEYIHAGKFAKDRFTTAEDILDIAYLGEKYELAGLHKVCDEMFSTKWDKTKAHDMLEIADKLKLAVTKARITEYLEMYYSGVKVVGNKRVKLA